MKRVVRREFSDPVRLEVVEEPTPAPAPGEVLAEIEAAAVSFVDGLIARGLYQVRPPLPYTPGMAWAGPPVGSAVAASAAESYSTMVFAVTRRVSIAPGGVGRGARRGRRPARW